jgi:DNA-binding transcriptional MerR regulator
MDPGLTIQQSAGKTGLSVYTIRYYERAGLLESVGRAQNGHRRFSDADIGRLEFIKCLRSTGMPIAEIQRYMELYRSGDRTTGERLELLEAHQRRIKRRMAELGQNLKKIEWKIGYYRSLGRKSG